LKKVGDSSQRRLKNMFHYLSKILVIILVACFILVILANIFAWQSIMLPLAVFTVLVFSFLAWQRLDFALYVLLSELVLGGAGGRWLSVDFFSIRIIFLGILFLIWLYRVLRKKIDLSPILKSKFSKPLLILALFFPIFWGLIGWTQGWPGKYILSDANGFLFYGLFFILITVLPKRINARYLVKIYLISIAAAAGILTVLYFLAVFKVANIWFLKQLFLGRMFYGGKIGIMPDSALRLFTGNGIFVVIGILIFASLVLVKKKLSRKTRNLILLAILFCHLAIVASYTRGFWVGIIGAAIFLLFFLPWKSRGKLLAGAIALFIISEIIFQGFFELSFFNFFFNRLATSVSVQADPVSLGGRLSQVRVLGGAILRHPFWGIGFGAYFSDYRTIQDVADPYSFELGYLDMTVKFGIIGFAFWGLIILGIFAKGLKLLWFKFDLARGDRALILGFLSGLVSLLIVGGTSPFLMSAFGITHIILTIYILEIISWNKKIPSR